MTNRQEAEDFLIGLGYFKGSPATTELSEILDRHVAEQREKVAAWMIHNGYSTGHGDTIEELLEELDWQWDEALKKQREACARKSKKVIDKYFRTSGHNKMMQGRIENACLNAVEEKAE